MKDKIRQFLTLFLSDNSEKMIWVQDDLKANIDGVAQK